MTLEEAKAYFQKLAQEAALPEAEVTAVLQAMGNEKFAKSVAGAMQRQDEFNRGMDQLRNKQTEMQTFYNDSLLPAYNANVQGLEQLKQYKTKFGDLADPNPNPANDGKLPTDLVRKPDLDKMLEQVKDGSYALSRELTRAGLNHISQFGKPLDLDALEKFALEHKLPIDQAYKELIAPDLEAKRNADVEVRVKREREEAVRDALSRHQIPVDTTPKDSFRPAFDAKVPAGTSAADVASKAREGFISGWNNWSPGGAANNQ